MRAAENVINGRVQMLSLSSIEKSSDRAIIYGVIGAHNYNRMFLHSSNYRVRPFGTSVTIGPFRFGIIIFFAIGNNLLSLLHNLRHFARALKNQNKYSIP